MGIGMGIGMGIRTTRARLAHLGGLACLLGALAGCAGLPPQVPRPPSSMLAAPADAPLPRLVAEAALPAGKSGFWPLPQASMALDARLALIRNARSSIDLQYYLIGNDTVGRLVLRELRDAAARGVRVRLLLDDLYTEGLDPLLLGLQAHPNVEVRLFNPFVSGRGFALGRFLSFAGDFRRLNHRMHNKLFIADATVAVAGGRNLADEYFLLGKEANFLDMDLLISGDLVHHLGELFDGYWNSEQVFPLTRIASSGLDAPARRQAFDLLTAGATAATAPSPTGPDAYGEPPFSAALAAGHQRWVVADAGAHADAPTKAQADDHSPGAKDTVTFRFITLLHEAQSELLLFSPYFIPGQQGLKHLREARDHGIQVRVVTNAMGSTDEPLVSVSYERYRNEMLAMGIQLYELSSTRLKHDPTLKRVLGSSRGRLHAKMAFIDRKTVLIGSMNMDLRSAYINTEIGIAVRSPELARLILEAYKADGFSGVYQVQLKPDGSGVQWVGHDEQGEEVLTDEPDVSLWQRFRLWLMFLFVPEDLL
jgi:phosphatidylserine/phosphatidylglycerophosphate/cardiolipin synthase-like enzyme